MNWVEKDRHHHLKCTFSVTVAHYSSRVKEWFDSKRLLIFFIFNVKNMFKKIIFAAVAMFTMLTTANAQIARENTKFFDNTYLTVEGGAFMPTDMNSVFPLNANAGVKLGKLINPVIGVNVEGTVMFGDNHYLPYSNTIVKASNVGVNFTIDTFNWFGGFKANRKFTIAPEFGLGWLHFYGTNFDNHKNALSAKTGIIFNWRVSNVVSLFAEPTMYWNLGSDPLHQVEFNKSHSQLGLQVGITFRFKNSNGKHDFVEYDFGAINAKLNELIAENNAMKDELAKKPTEVVKETTTTITKTEYVENLTYVLFAQNSSTLSEDAKATLSNIAKKVSEVKIVRGYASPEGTKAYNQSLSERRAFAVADYLKANGVNVQEVIGNGSTGNESNRVVIVEVK